MTGHTPENQGLSDTDKDELKKLHENHKNMTPEEKKEVNEVFDGLLKEKVPFYKLLLDMNGGDPKKVEQIPIIGGFFKLFSTLTGMFKFMATGDTSAIEGKGTENPTEAKNTIAATLDKIKGTDYFMPLPSVTEAKEAGYDADTGLDIYAPVGTPAHSIANGKIIYSEKGHTSWQANDKHPHDTGNSVLIQLDEPLKKNGKVVTAPDGQPVKYIWYTHLSELTFNIKDGSAPKAIKAGELVGKTGTGNDNPHLHFGLLSNRSQAESTFVKMPQVREFLNLAPKQAIAGSNERTA